VNALADRFFGVMDTAMAQIEDPNPLRTAADLISIHPAVIDGQRAMAIVTALKGQHVPVRWAEGSETVVCAECTGVAWPCGVVETISGGTE
jgi:hypothetical protein